MENDSHQRRLGKHQLGADLIHNIQNLSKWKLYYIKKNDTCAKRNWLFPVISLEKATPLKLKITIQAKDEQRIAVSPNFNDGDVSKVLQYNSTLSL